MPPAKTASRKSSQPEANSAQVGMVSGVATCVAEGSPIAAVSSASSASSTPEPPAAWTSSTVGLHDVDAAEQGAEAHRRRDLGGRADVDAAAAMIGVEERDRIGERRRDRDLVGDDHDAEV